MRKGRTITPETAAELADIAGENVKLAVYQAMIERSKGTRREGALREILGKSLLAGVVGMLLFSYAPEVKAVTIPTNEKLANLLTNYTSWKMLRAFFRRLFQPAHWVFRANMGEPPHPPRCLSLKGAKSVRLWRRYAPPAPDGFFQ